MSRFQTATLVILLVSVGTGDASAARWRRRQDRVAPLAATSAVEPSAKPRSPELQRLYDLRVEAAEKQYEFAVEIFKGGRLESPDLFKAQTQLQRASFEAATAPESRLRVLESSVKHAKFNHDFISAAVDRGIRSEFDRVAARHALLTAEIELAEEKESQAANRTNR